jgi:hypothetical protein
VTGAVQPDAGGQIFVFRPDVPYTAGNRVGVTIENSVYTSTGVRVEPGWQSSFRTAAPAPSFVSPVAFHVSAAAIDVRFDGPAPPGACGAYLRSGAARIPTRCVTSAEDQIRITSEVPLTAGGSYRLVLDAISEIAFDVASTDTEEFSLKFAGREPGGDIVLYFQGAANPLSVSRGGIQLLAPNGRRVPFTMQTSLDGRVIRLVPAIAAPGLTVRVDGAESRSGTRLGQVQLAPR